MLAEKAVLSRILFSNEWNNVMDRRVTEELFQDMECRKCFKYVYDFYSKYGKVPSIDLVEEEFKDLSLEYAKEPIDYYLDKMTENYVRVKGSQVLLGAAREIVQSPMKGIEKLQTAVAELTLEAVPTRDDLVEDTVEDRKARYLRLKKVGGMDGIPTPWEVLNEATMGLHGGDFIAIVSRPGVGKEQPLDSLLYGPQGPYRMREVRVGSAILGKDGKVYSVTGVYPQGRKMSYRVTFSDGSSTECGIDHLWTVRHRRKDEFVTMTLRQLLDAGLTDVDHAKWVLPMAQPAEFNKRDLPIDPYVLGCLIADGSLRSQVKFCNSEEDVVAKFIARLPKSATVGKVIKGREYPIRNLYRELDTLGLRGKKSFERFIPEAYKYSSITDRIDILQGLFDCDGYTTKHGTHQYSTSSRKLAEDVRFLVESLGGTARLTEKQPKYRYKGELKEGRIAYTLTIVLPDGIECYSSKKHAERSIKKGRLKPYRNIVSIEEAGMKEMQCIMVDAPDHLYLTDHFIVTHNTFMLTLFAEYAVRNKLKVLFVTNEMSNTQIMQRFDAVYFKLPYKELRAGLLPDALEKIYFEGLEKMKKDVKMVVTQDVHGVNSVGSKIDQYKPDLVLIDGMYLLADDQNSQSRWEGISNISRNLKKLARKKNVPIIATTQFNRASEGVKIDKVTLSNLGFSDSIGQDADAVLGLFRTKDMEMNNEMKVRMLKVREGEPKDFTLQWDLRHMRFDAIETSDDDSFLPEEIDEGTISY